MMLIEQALGESFIRKVQEKKPGWVIEDFDRNLIELAVAGIFAVRKENLFWVLGENENFAEKAEQVSLWLRFLGQSDVTVHIYPLPFADPYVAFQAEMKSLETKARLLSDWKQGRKTVVVTTLAALALKSDEIVAPTEGGIEVESGSALPRAEFLDRLEAFRFFRSDYVENKGDYSWRGNVVDLFPLDADHPLRIEFEGDRIVSLRFFDPSTQRSVSPASRFFIYSPAALEPRSPDFARRLDRRRSLGALAEKGILVSSGYRRLADEFGKLLEHFSRIRANMPDASVPGVEFFFSPIFCEEQFIDILEFPRSPKSVPAIVAWNRTLKNLDESGMNELKEKARAGVNLFFFSLERKLAQKTVAWIGSGEAMETSIPQSFENLEARTLFLAAREYRHVEKAESEKPIAQEKWVNEIQSGDFIVHRFHGIGRFRGFRKLSVENASQEFLWVEYQNREFLYVPPLDADVLSRYKGFEGQVPSLDRLGGKTWKVKVYRAKRRIVDFARDLLELYALRQSIDGFSYPRQPEFEEKLQESFAYVETEDQKRAIREALHDLEQGFPMDRLVCGDVSFGKTEIAVRAAARVVANHRQVAVLCPTTILAFQHFQTFSRRFADLPVKIAMLSRMVSPAEKAKIKKSVAAGKIDILIGTHSLLSQTVEFPRLGLYVIDEEQRFGVFQKEKLKKRREEVDVLVLTATPIPRTLSLALNGLQDISLIRTPPIGRLAVQNFIGLFSREVIVSALLNEIERDGQVYIVYNSIERIHAFRDQLQEWLPDVSILVLHAQLPPAQIERNMMAFIRREHRVLLSTTIIENGIDIPAVNTLIVVNADCFGLTQLYQLRGRIGRSDRQAHAYFLVDPRRGDLTDKAAKRLDAIREFSELGSGYKIAEFDLMLRGAGALLGSRQHGHVEALGFDYYMELIQQSVKSLKGAEAASFSPELHVHFPYAITETYIENPTERLYIYRRILAAKRGEDLYPIQEELEDQYGRLPHSMERLFYVGAAKLFAQKYLWKRVDLHHDRMVFVPQHPLAGRVAPFRSVEGNAVMLPFRSFSRFVEECQKWAKYFPEQVAGGILQKAEDVVS